MKKMYRKILHLFKLCTQSEFDDLDKRWGSHHLKRLEETKQESIRSGRIMALFQVIAEMKAINGFSGDEWAEHMYNFVNKLIEEE